MNSRRAFYFQQVVKQVALGGVGVVAITAVCYPMHLDFTVSGCLYLLLVVLLSAFASFTSSAIVSVIAILCLDYFFVPPLLNLRISRPVDGLALFTFLSTALVITRLASKARAQAQSAEARRKDLARLYELASRLVSIPPDIAVKREYLGTFRDIFDLRAVCLFDGGAAAISCDGDSQHDLVERTRKVYVSGRDYSSENAKIAVRTLTIAEKQIGAVGFEGLRDADATAGPLSMLVAAMIQRAHSFETASEAAAAAQVEVLRSAILDAFTHQFKSPLASILAAAGALDETGPLLPEQQVMVETIEAEAAGLGRLTTRLLRMARLDQVEIKPKMRFTDLAGLLVRLTEPYRRQEDGHRLVLQFGDDPVEVLSDPDMLGLAIVQLIDNAFRYSGLNGAITVTASYEGDSSLVRVTNEGSRILPEEQNRIFDRFYRGTNAQESPGSGLGLYVARKIVMAHGGSLELDKEQLYGRDTTFCLRLPAANNEGKHETKASQSVDCR
jgi:two-component system, OmpR family, sensor histidine kinase KdpD